MCITFVTADKEMPIFKYSHYNVEIWRLVSYNFFQIISDIN